MFDDSITGSAGFGKVTGSPTKQTGRKISNCLPMWIGHIHACVADVSLFGVIPNIVCIVGVLKNYDLQHVKASYMIEDDTGTIEALLWMDGDMENVQLPKVKEGRFVKVYGSIRVHSDSKKLLVMRLYAIEDPNEITTHMLEVIHTRCYLEKKATGGGDKPMSNQQSTLASTMGQLYNADNTDTGLSAMQKQIMAIVKADNSPNGIHTSNIYKNFDAGHRREVERALEFLQSEGHLFTTIDDVHVKQTDI